MNLSDAIVNRWALSNGDIAIAIDAGAVTASAGSVVVDAVMKDGHAHIAAADVLRLAPELGCFEINWSSADALLATTVLERVSVRYCTKEELIAYGEKNGDGFDESEYFTDARISEAIQAAEEAIEAGTRRSFCKRAIQVPLTKSVLNELPVVDAQTISVGRLVNDRQAYIDRTGVATVVFGAQLTARIKAAAIKLAALYVRPRAGAENARGQSQDGVYVSFELATGSDGSWTSIPEVNAVIAENRSRRVIIG